MSKRNRETLARFKPQQRNANKHTARGLKLLDDSIQRDGWIGAMTVAADGETFDGSARLERSAEIFGEDTAPIIVESDGTRPVIVKRVDIPNVADPRAKRLGLAANRIAEIDLAWDEDVIAEIAENERALLDGLFNRDELAGIIGYGQVYPNAGELVDRAAELNQKWNVARGDVWEIASDTVRGAGHRLVCGDCTNASDLEKLTRGARMDAIVTDPPYNFHIGGGGIGNKRSTRHKADLEPLTNFVPQAFRETLAAIEWGVACLFCNKALLPDYLEFARARQLFFNLLVWCKRNPLPLTNNTFLPDVEYVIWLANSSRHFTAGLEYRDYSKWYVSEIHAGRSEGDELHPTIKPLEFIKRLVMVNAPRGGSVGDLFAGSGTTLVACETLGRVGYVMEIEPAYCAVILERLAGMGMQPKRMTHE